MISAPMVTAGIREPDVVRVEGDNTEIEFSGSEIDVNEEWRSESDDDDLTATEATPRHHKKVSLLPLCHDERRRRTKKLHSHLAKENLPGSLAIVGFSKHATTASHNSTVLSQLSNATVDLSDEFPIPYIRLDPNDRCTIFDFKRQTGNPVIVLLITLPAVEWRYLYTRVNMITMSQYETTDDDSRPAECDDSSRVIGFERHRDDDSLSHYVTATVRKSPPWHSIPPLSITSSTVPTATGGGVSTIECYNEDDEQWVNEDARTVVSIPQHCSIVITTRRDEPRQR
ncbi:hypothetical protein EAI_05237 [Harpegnathos saltator]|uniref:Uncharacterized protein n=1 Tax=Harpegnathos saltator TaxID=610380 RepID=E2C9S2_HARSA|nr:hypothetical protein EAI_05237 [Harpegnathos saltator]